MKRRNRWLAIAALVCIASFNSNRIMAQPPGGGPDPARMAEFQQRRMDDLREQMEIKEDAEWKAVQPLIQKVMDASRNVMRDRMGGGMFGRGGGRRGGDNNNANNNGGDQGNRRFRGGGGGFMGEPSAEVQALQRAIDSKASKSELKAALAKVQEARKTHMEELEKAQTDLRKVLSVNQEAVATLNGLL